MNNVPETLAQMRVRVLKLALKKADGHQINTAKLLGISERTVRQMIKFNKINVEDYKKRGSN
jgi:DNA-binding NtrC family response regulator